MNKRYRVARGFVTLLILAPLAGCSAKQSDGSNVGRAGPSPAPTIVNPVILTPVNRAAFDAEIGKHRGNIVLVDFWATWCPPCVESLPHVIELGRMHADRGLNVVLVSCDEPDNSKYVADFLASRQAGVATNLISQYGGTGQSMVEFEIQGGAVPFYQLYDRTGKLRKTFGLVPPDEIDKAVERLLAE